MSTTKIPLPLKWHGGKKDLASWIISLMPPRCQNPNKPVDDDPGWLHYVEPYFGGGAVLLTNDPEGISEVVNDLNGDLTNFWEVLQSDSLFPKFLRIIQATPFSETEWRISSCFAGNNPQIRARDFFVRCRQSLAGRMKSFTGVTKTRIRRRMNNEVSAWLTGIEGLPAVHDRLKRVLIVGPDDALNVIRKHDGPRTLFYLDPPYLHETRATTGEYEYEMTETDHKRLLMALTGPRFKGRFLLSGYRSNIYDQHAELEGWIRHEMKINNHAAGGKTKKIMTECAWANYRPAPSSLATPDASAGTEQKDAKAGPKKGLLGLLT